MFILYEHLTDLYPIIFLLYSALNMWVLQPILSFLMSNNGYYLLLNVFTENILFLLRLVWWNVADLLVILTVGLLSY